MFDLGWTEMAIIVIVVLLVVGPKDLPKVVRNVRIWIKKARGMVRELQSGVDDMVREAELQDLKNEVRETAKESLGGDLDDLIDPTDGDFDLPDLDDDPDAVGDVPSIEDTASVDDKTRAKTGQAASTAAGDAAMKKPAASSETAKADAADTAPEAPRTATGS